MPKSWKDIILKDKLKTKNLVIFDHHTIRKSQICTFNKLTSKELYSILVDENTVKLTAQHFFFQFVILLWIQRCVCSSAKFYVIFDVLTKSFLNLEKYLLHDVLSVNYMIKQLCTFFMIADLLKDYGIN